jgi:hypothetical protein
MAAGSCEDRRFLKPVSPLVGSLLRPDVSVKKHLNDWIKIVMGFAVSCSTQKGDCNPISNRPR